MKLFMICLVLFVCHIPRSALSSDKCINIFYDEGPEDYIFGRVYAIYLRNLLGHFPERKIRMGEVEKYKSGQIEECQTTFYLGSYFENDIPQVFLDDFKNTNKNVAWLGYSVWMYPPEDQKKLFSAQYSHLTTLDREKLNPNGKPSFYQNISYKGEDFHKFGEWVQRDGETVFAAPFEMVVMNIDAQEEAPEVLSWATQTVTGEKAPYIIRKKNHFFVADIPFSYVHEADRYLIFSDLVFDILEESPRREENLAVVRIEDVHPLSNIRDLEKMSKVFEEEEVPLHVSLIPIFYDPLYRFPREADQEWVTIKEHVPFKLWLERAKQKDTHFIWHGVTHQYKNIANPHTGFSSADFEFWDANNNTVIQEDSVDFVLNRLHLGYDYLKDMGVNPRVWLTPHYQASSLDYRIFAKVFEWNMGRVIYFVDEPTELPNWSQEDLLTLRFNEQAENIHERQKEYFRDFSTTMKGKWFGQLFPYEIYGDQYGQRVFPEMLGNPQPFKGEHVIYPRSVDQILEDAKRNRVVRDCWASVFFHPFLLNDFMHDGIGKYLGDDRELRRLIRGLKELGYEFINLNDFMDKTKDIKNIEVEELK